MMQVIRRIIKWFSKDKGEKMSEQTPVQVTPTQAKKRKHKLEIQVYEADYEKCDANNGQPQWRPVRSDPTLDGGRPNIIEVADKKEFMEIQRQYAMCDQRIKVIREIDPFVDEEPEQPKPKANSIPQDNQAIPVNSISTVGVQSNASQPTQSSTVQMVIPEHAKAAAAQIVEAFHIARPKPKIVTIGDIEVKYDGDKVYQKQWMKLTPAEASNFRVVNDANNKIISLNGKHIEAKRWMLVEENVGSKDDDMTEKLIEG